MIYIHLRFITCILLVIHKNKTHFHFSFIDHSFLISALERYGLGKRFFNWVQILLKNQESCIINGGNTTLYFKLEKGTRKVDPVSV